MPSESELEALRARLELGGIDTSTWRRPATRSVDDLAREIERRESQLDGPPFLRRLRIVKLHIERQGLLLHELWLAEEDGRRLDRDRPPAEKLLADEAPAWGALRCVNEELACSSERVELLEVVATGTERLDHNPGYPGLPTEYTIHTARLRVADLPRDDFETVEHEAGSGGRRVVHGWGWRGPAARG